MFFLFFLFFLFFVFFCYDFFCFVICFATSYVFLFYFLFSLSCVKDSGFVLYFVFFESVSLLFFLLSTMTCNPMFAKYLFFFSFGVFPFVSVGFDLLSFFNISGVIMWFAYPKVFYLILALNFPEFFLSVLLSELVFMVSLVFCSFFSIFCSYKGMSANMFSLVLYISNFLFIFSIIFSPFASILYGISSCYLAYLCFNYSLSCSSYFCKCFYGMPFSFLALYKYIFLMVIFDFSIPLFVCFSFCATVILVSFAFSPYSNSKLGDKYSNFFKSNKEC